MRAGETNDLGLGTCPRCKDWKKLTSFYWLDDRLPRRERRKICAACNAVRDRDTDPFFFARKAIATHKLISGESDYTLEDLKILHKKQGFMCPYCKEPIHYGFTIDHVVPQRAGGLNRLSNVLLACLRCNSSKQDFELAYWLNRKGYKAKPKILLIAKGAYDVHGYEFPAQCGHCEGSINQRICSRTEGSPNRRCLSHPEGRRVSQECSTGNASTSSISACS